MLFTYSNYISIPTNFNNLVIISTIVLDNKLVIICKSRHNLFSVKRNDKENMEFKKGKKRNVRFSSSTPDNLQIIIVNEFQYINSVAIHCIAI